MVLLRLLPTLPRASACCSWETLPAAAFVALAAEPAQLLSGDSLSAAEQPAGSVPAAPAAPLGMLAAALADAFLGRWECLVGRACPTAVSPAVKPAWWCPVGSALPGEPVEPSELESSLVCNTKHPVLSEACERALLHGSY